MSPQRQREAVDLIRLMVQVLGDRDHDDLLPDLQMLLYDAKQWLRGETTTTAPVALPEGWGTVR